MEVVQMMECLLARMEAKMDSNKKKVEADRDELKAEWTPARKRWRPEWRNLKKIWPPIEKPNEELLAKISARVDTNMTKMTAILSELEGTIKRQMQHFLSYVDERTQKLPDAMKIEQDPRMMQSVEEHQEVPREEVTVTPVRGLKKQCRVQKLAAECPQKLKERNWGCCGSQKRVTIADRRMFRHARLAWHKRTVFRKNQIQGSRESRKKLPLTE
jgi:hypothetical protein